MRSITGLFLTAATLLTLNSASQGATVPDDMLLVPGERVGKVSLGMTQADVEERLGKPTKEKEGYYMEYTDKDDILDIFFTNQEVAEIRFNNKSFKTNDGLSLTTFTQKKYRSDFDFARMQTKFMNTRQILKSGGLAMYKLDIDGAAGVKTTTVGLVYKERPRHQARMFQGEKDGGWEDWDGQSSTLFDEFKNPAARAMKGIDAGGW